MPWQQRVIDGQLLFDGDGDFLHRMSMVSTARQNGKTVALTSIGGDKKEVCKFRPIRIPKK